MATVVQASSSRSLPPGTSLHFRRAMALPDVLAGWGDILQNLQDANVQVAQLRLKRYEQGALRNRRVSDGRALTPEVLEQLLDALRQSVAWPVRPMLHARLARAAAFFALLEIVWVHRAAANAR